MSRQCNALFFVEIHKQQTKLRVFEAWGVANFGTGCRYNKTTFI